MPGMPHELEIIEQDTIFVIMCLPAFSYFLSLIIFSGQKERDLKLPSSISSCVEIMTLVGRVCNSP
jgi:hypothetical protein